MLEYEDAKLFIDSYNEYIDKNIGNATPDSKPLITIFNNAFAKVARAMQASGRFYDFTPLQLSDTIKLSAPLTLANKITYGASINSITIPSIKFITTVTNKLSSNVDRLEIVLENKTDYFLKYYNNRLTNLGDILPKVSKDGSFAFLDSIFNTVINNTTGPNDSFSNFIVAINTLIDSAILEPGSTAPEKLRVPSLSEISDTGLIIRDDTKFTNVKFYESDTQTPTIIVPRIVIASNTVTAKFSQVVMKPMKVNQNDIEGHADQRTYLHFTNRIATTPVKR
jgi:hypothetical protein